MSWTNLFRPKHTCAYSHLSTAEHQEVQLTVVFKRGEDGYVVAECLQLPGCMSQGVDEEEAKRNIVNAIQSCLTVRIQELLAGSYNIVSTDLVGIQSQETLRVKPPELELVAASGVPC
jgi:predicted RNase H-like HicB family nuclease